MKLLKDKILFPPIGLLILLTVFSAVSLTTVFANGWEASPLAYVSYFLSAYTLTAICIRIPGLHPVKNTRRLICSTTLGNRYMTDHTFKARVSLYLSLGINLLYSVFKFLTGICYASVWLGALAIYYSLLATLRFLLLRHMKRNQTAPSPNLISEYRRYRLCGYLLIGVHIVLAGMVVQMVQQNQSYQYPGTMIYAVAAYTFWTVTVSILNLVKYRRYASPVLSASKILCLASALVSLLALETAMIARFGEDESFRRTMVSLTGTAVCLIVLGMSIYMVIRSNRELKKLYTERKS